MNLTALRDQLDFWENMMDPCRCFADMHSIAERHENALLEITEPTGAEAWAIERHQETPYDMDALTVLAHGYMRLRRIAERSLIDAVLPATEVRHG